MSFLRAIAGIAGDAFMPDETMVRNRARVTADRVITFGVTLLAIGLAVGYQFFLRWGHLIFGED